MNTPFATTDRQFYYPNKMGRIILLAMEEVMGRNGVNAILNLARLKSLVNSYPPNNFDRQFTFSEVGSIQQALEDMYGPRGARGLALRAGRACFKYGIKEFGPVLGIADLAFRLLPLGMKVKVGIEVFAETFNKFSDQIVRLGEDDEHYIWIIDRCPVCWKRRTDEPCCHRGRHFAGKPVLGQQRQEFSRGRSGLHCQGRCHLHHHYQQTSSRLKWRSGR
jgi:hypothetical protein